MVYFFAGKHPLDDISQYGKSVVGHAILTDPYLLVLGIFVSLKQNYIFLLVGVDFLVVVLPFLTTSTYYKHSNK